jgi:hypothetical protein
MAHDKRKRNMDIALRATLKGLDRALLDIRVEEKRPDEFTAVELSERLKSEGSCQTKAAIRQKLGRMAADGKLLSRKIVISGYTTTVYRYPDQEKS